MLENILFIPMHIIDKRQSFVSRTLQSLQRRKMLAQWTDVGKRGEVEETAASVCPGRVC